MDDINGVRVYSIIRKHNDSYVASFPTHHRCHEYMKFRKEQLFFDTGNMEEAEKEYGQSQYYIAYSFALEQSSIALFAVNFSDWP